MLLRTTLAVLLLAAVLYFVGSSEILEVLSNVQWPYVLILILLSVIMIWASCLKWQLFIREDGKDVPMAELMRLYTISYFYNTFMPAYVGGDIARSFHLGRYLGSQRQALVATFLERFTGLLAMSVLGVLFVCIGTEITSGLAVSILLVAGVSFLMAVACFSRFFGALSFSTAKYCLRILPGALASKAEAVVAKVDSGMEYARGNKSLLFRSLVLSLFFHTLTVVNTYVAARAIGWDDPSISGLFIAVPLVLLVSMLPITPGSLGVQEGAFVFFLERVGSTRAEGLAVALILRAKVLLLAALGGALLAFMKSSSKTE